MAAKAKPDETGKIRRRGSGRAIGVLVDMGIGFCFRLVAGAAEGFPRSSSNTAGPNSDILYFVHHACWIGSDVGVALGVGLQEKDVVGLIGDCFRIGGPMLAVAGHLLASIQPHSADSL